MNSSKDVSASFVPSPPPVPDRTLTVQVSGPGTVQGEGLSCPPGCAQTYTDKTSVTLTAAAGSTGAFSGWGGACAGSGTSSTCALTMDGDKTVTASFAALPNLDVSRTGNGGGTVTSAPSGIDCGSICSAHFPGMTQVTLTAAAAKGSFFAGWGGACSGNAPACAVTLDADREVTADFELVPVIGDLQTRPLPPILPARSSSLSVNIAGDGTVSSVAAGRSLSGTSALAIRCGLAGFACYTSVSPGKLLTLRAVAGSGSQFKGWDGACAGQGLLCHVTLNASRSVTAHFDARAGAAAVAASLERPRFRVRWSRSVGSGLLIVTGRVGKPALVRLQLRRPHGAALLTESLTVGAGRFRQTPRLLPGLLARGAHLFPGGFVVSLAGRSGRLRLPLQLDTIVLPAPREGVVRRAFASRSAGVPATSVVPASNREAWANFVFEAQPKAGLPLTVTWYLPGGKFLGMVKKSNRPTVTSFLRAVPGAALPAGDWRAELRAGGKIVSVLFVRVR